jgi:hypothetical protein
MTTPAGTDPRDPQAILELPWRTDSVTRTFAPRFLHSFGLFAVATRRPARIEMIDGTPVLEGGVFAFDIATDIGTDLDETIDLAVVVDHSARALLVGWDANLSPENAMAVEIPSGSEPWTTVVAQLERARFVGRGPRGTDVVVAAPGCDFSASATGPDEIRIRDVRVARGTAVPQTPPATARLEVTILDEHGLLTAARVGIYQAETGREVLASPDAVLVPRYFDEIRDLGMPSVSAAESGTGMPRPLWPHANRWVVYADGVYRVAIPPAAYDVVATRGPEYRHLVRRVEVGRSDITRVELRFARWRDLPAEGWWSGDGHVHIAREDAGDDPALSVSRAEDVHVANVLAMGNIGAPYFPQRAYGPRGRSVRGDHHVVSGQEDPRTGRRGHTLHLNVAERHRDPDRYFLYHEAFTRLRAGGSVSGYAHVGSGWFGESAGLALDVPFGIVDVVEVLQADRLRLDPWYDFLNLGFRLTPIAGSDFPYIDLVGTVRSFAHVEGPLTPDAWFAAIRAGRTFVSNGPTLSLHVGSVTMGEELRIDPGERLSVRAEADLNPDLGTLERLELVVCGEVVSTAEGPGRIVMEHSFVPNAGCWVAARATGSNMTVGHTAPAYVLVGGADHTWHAPAVPALVDRMAGVIRDLTDDKPDVAVEEFETWDSEASYLSHWQEQLSELRTRAAQAIARYEEIRAAAATGPSGTFLS